jgi:hypothetical protein
MLLSRLLCLLHSVRRFLLGFQQAYLLFDWHIIETSEAKLEAVVKAQVVKRQAAYDVIRDRACRTDIAVVSDTAWREAGTAERLHVALQRHTVLQTMTDADSE